MPNLETIGFTGRTLILGVGYRAKYGRLTICLIAITDERIQILVQIL
jgi:hypothetical protein